VTPATAPARMPADALAFLYDLTPAEARIFELISVGMAQAAIGQTLGIARSTVKTHVRHLFSKTGNNRQADLLRLASTLSMPG
jgi:DNA-binding CsgD family transcriptional regulator